MIQNKYKIVALLDTETVLRDLEAVGNAVETRLRRDMGYRRLAVVRDLEELGFLQDIRGLILLIQAFKTKFGQDQKAVACLYENLRAVLQADVVEEPKDVAPVVEGSDDVGSVTDSSVSGSDDGPEEVETDGLRILVPIPPALPKPFAEFSVEESAALKERPASFCFERITDIQRQLEKDLGVDEESREESERLRRAGLPQPPVIVDIEQTKKRFLEAMAYLQVFHQTRCQVSFLDELDFEFIVLMERFLDVTVGVVGNKWGEGYLNMLNKWKDGIVVAPKIKAYQDLLTLNLGLKEKWEIKLPEELMVKVWQRMGDGQILDIRQEGLSDVERGLIFSQ